MAHCVAAALRHGTSLRRIMHATYIIYSLAHKIWTYVLYGTLSQKNRTPVVFSNNSNNLGSISTNFDKRNRLMSNYRHFCYFMINFHNCGTAEVFLWHPQWRQLHGNIPTKQQR